jgi:hypothetical protein
MLSAKHKSEPGARYRRAMGGTSEASEGQDEYRKQIRFVQEHSRMGCELDYNSIIMTRKNMGQRTGPLLHFIVV